MPRGVTTGMLLTMLAAPAAAQGADTLEGAVRRVITEGSIQRFGQLNTLVPAQREGLIACVAKAMAEMPPDAQVAFVAERDLRKGLETIGNFDATVEGDPVAACLRGALGR